MRSGLLNQFQQDFFVCYSRFQEFCQIQLFFNPKRIWRYYIRLIPSLFLCTLVAELEQMPKWLPINLKVSLIDKFYIFNSWQIIHRQDLLWGLKKIHNYSASRLVDPNLCQSEISFSCFNLHEIFSRMHKKHEFRFVV